MTTIDDRGTMAANVTVDSDISHEIPTMNWTYTVLGILVYIYMELFNN